MFLITLGIFVLGVVVYCVKRYASRIDFEKLLFVRDNQNNELVQAVINGDGIAHEILPTQEEIDLEKQIEEAYKIAQEKELQEKNELFFTGSEPSSELVMQDWFIDCKIAFIDSKMRAFVNDNNGEWINKTLEFNRMMHFKTYHCQDHVDYWRRHCYNGRIYSFNLDGIIKRNKRMENERIRMENEVNRLKCMSHYYESILNR